MNSEHWLLVADVAGRITTLKVDPANPIQATFGAFNDSKTQQTRIVLMFVQGTIIFALSESGLLRKWNC